MFSPIKTLPRPLFAPILLSHRTQILIPFQAGGRIFGPQLLKELQASPQQFNIILLTRPSSSTPLPEGFHIIKHDYDDPALASVLRDLDIHAIIASISGAATMSQIPLIDAAAASGTVRRFIPSEFGYDGLSPKVRELLPPCQWTQKVREHLIEVQKTKEGAQLSWSVIACGMWIDHIWKAGNAHAGGKFINYNIEDAKATVWDEGDVRVSCTTVGTSALAVVRVLEKEEETRDRYLYVAEMTKSQNEIIVFLEEKKGRKFERETRSTEEAERASKELWKNASENGTFSYEGLILGFNRIMYGPGKESDWTDRNDNALLGIETKSIEEILKVCGVEL